MSAEHDRLADAVAEAVPWRRWGPYLSERQWGTVREDYSGTGDAWNHFPHDHARSRAYRWGEDGLGGISDDRQLLCFSPALWNGADPIVKERPFGLTNGEGNHGEDVKDYYFYLDSTPTHSYMRFLYKYPHQAFPYLDLVETNGRRGRREFEYELLDTGIFDEDRYFDVEVEYAKAGPEDLLVQFTVVNRGPGEAVLELLPTLWFRDTWSRGEGPRPRLTSPAPGTVRAEHPDLGTYHLYCEGGAELLFTENATDRRRVFGEENGSAFVKDGIGRHLIEGADTVNPGRTGTKAAARSRLVLPGGGTGVVRLRLARGEVRSENDLLTGAFTRILDARRKEADEFYSAITPAGAGEDQARILRQSLSGLLWSKQFYAFDVDAWLAENGVDPWTSPATRDQEWFHLDAGDIISMPDKWEYPWFAAWDLAFQAVAFAAVDPDFAKRQIELLLDNRYLNPNGQIPAYEWNFSDVNPPMHAWAARFVFMIEYRLTGAADHEFLERVFHKLLLNFTWWVNRKDPEGSNVFDGGFLGLDNIGVFDRSAPLPAGGRLEQADGTAWMAFYSQCMLQMALDLTDRDPAYEELAVKFAEHFLWISAAMGRADGPSPSMWDEKDGFFYDVLRTPDGNASPVKVRSLVGLLPLCASTVYRPRGKGRGLRFQERIEALAARHPQLLAGLSLAAEEGENGTHLLSPLNEENLRRVLARLLDEEEFLSPFGIRSVSRAHAGQPYVFTAGGRDYEIGYLPAESDNGMFGGNSNWRGPVWFPMNALIIRALLNLHEFYGDGFTVECPSGSGRKLTLDEVGHELSDRLSRIFLRDADGVRPVYGGQRKFQDDPHWRDLIMFYEYFHGDNGAGIGAGHQTGWTALVSTFMILFGKLDER
ncbi:MGH1-like glycoside hydrolase domain-containing protein [Actinocorallia longicatena]|uniref:Glucosidase n=1 Tax=Actinocorallia longicatena TaxID=111803 RepID=A0ABP6QBI8_9ACTN